MVRPCLTLPVSLPLTGNQRRLFSVDRSMRSLFPWLNVLGFFLFYPYTHTHTHSVLVRRSRKQKNKSIKQSLLRQRKNCGWRGSRTGRKSSNPSPPSCGREKLIRNCVSLTEVIDHPKLSINNGF